MRRTPYPHQQEAVSAIAAHFSAGATRCKVIMACATGKTLVSAWASQRLGVRRIVFLAPSIHVAGQAAKEWAAVGIEASAVVCSDSEASENSVVTTDAARIADTIRGRDDWAVFGTYASADRIGAALLSLNVSADALICDEAHHIAGKEGKKFAGVLFDDVLPAKRRMFFTATPRVASRGDDVGMNDAALFGEVAHYLGFGEAIRRKLIADYTVRCIEVPAETNLDDVAAMHAAIHAAIAREMRAGLRAPLLFRSSIKAAKFSAARFEEMGIAAGVVHGGQSIKVRLSTIADTLARGGVVLTVDALGEGVDVPAFGAAGFIDSRSSLIKIVQNVSRALRTGGDPDKVAVIVVPVCVKPGERVEILGTMGRVLSALREHDERMEDVIRAMIAERQGGRPASEEQRAQVVAWGLRDILDGPAGGAVLRDVVGEDGWIFERGFARLLAFVEREGHARVHTHHSEGGFPLGRWVSHRRAAGGDHPTAHRLSQIPGWRWGKRRPAWEESLAEWSHYVRIHGRRPRVAHGDPDERTLGQWGASVRKRAKQGLLAPHQKEMLARSTEWDDLPSRRPCTDDGRKRGQASFVATARAKSATVTRKVVTVVGAAGSVALVEARAEGVTRQNMARAIKDGLVAKSGTYHRPLYRLTPAGKAALAAKAEGSP